MSDSDEPTESLATPWFEAEWEQLELFEPRMIPAVTHHPRSPDASLKALRALAGSIPWTGKRDELVGECPQCGHDMLTVAGSKRAICHRCGYKEPCC